jgi:hypothetical protein
MTDRSLVLNATCHSGVSAVDRVGCPRTVKSKTRGNYLLQDKPNSRNWLALHVMAGHQHLIAGTTAATTHAL